MSPAEPFATIADVGLTVYDTGRAAMKGDWLGAGTALTTGLGAAAVPFLGYGAIRHMRRGGAIPTDEAPMMSPKDVQNSHRIGYNLPSIKQRPFESDYPLGAQVNDRGYITQDIDGDPITVPPHRIAGRREAGGEDVAIAPSEFDAIGKEGTGAVVAYVPRNQIPGKGRPFGAVVRNNRSGRPEGVLIDKSLDAAPGKGRDKVLSHELGHVIDDLAKGMGVNKGLKHDFERLYNHMLSGQDRQRNLTRPDNIGYEGDDIRAELAADAIKAYMQNPNFMKEKYPDIAARIRKFAKGNPEVSKIIQFNSVAPVAGLLGAGALGLRLPNEDIQTVP